MKARDLKIMVSSCIASQIHLTFVGEEGITITTPYIDRHRGYIAVNVTCCDGKYRVFEEDVAAELGTEIPEWVIPMLKGNTCELTGEGIAYKCHELELVGIGVQEVGQCAAQISAGLAVAGYWLPGGFKTVARS